MFNRRSLFKYISSAITSFYVSPLIPAPKINKKCNLSDLYISKEAMEDIKNWNLIAYRDKKQEIYIVNKTRKD